MSTTITNREPDRDLVEVLRDAIKAANASWTETDKLYMSVCTALVAVATLFGRSSGGWQAPMTLLGVLVLLLSVTWMLLIRRYLRIVETALERLANEYDGSSLGTYFKEEHEHYKKDLRDYLVAAVVFLMALVMIFYSTCSRAQQIAGPERG